MTGSVGPPRSPFRAHAPAKVNLTLAVARRGPDGYHPLRSVFLRLGLSDMLTMSPAAGDRDRLTVAGPVNCPVEGNLVLRALDEMRGRLRLPLPPLDVHLEKHIPVAAGLGGGSSDAAATIRLAEAAWGVAISPAQRQALALAVGSDVPFFDADEQTALVSGRGGDVTRLRGLDGEAAILLATSDVAIATGAAFARHDEIRADDESGAAVAVTDELAAAFEHGLDGTALEEWAPRLRDANDLWDAAASIAPMLGRLRSVLEEATGRPWLLSGSGSTLFAIFASSASSEPVARRLPAVLRPSFPGVRLVLDNLASPDAAWRYPP